MLSLLGTRNNSVTISLFLYLYIIFHYFATAFTIEDLRLSEHVGEEAVALGGVLLEVLEVLGHGQAAQDRLRATLENTDVIELVVTRENVGLVTLHHMLQIQVLVRKVHVGVHAAPLLATPQLEGGDGGGAAHAAPAAA